MQCAYHGFWRVHVLDAKRIPDEPSRMSNALFPKSSTISESLSIIEMLGRRDANEALPFQ